MKSSIMKVGYRTFSTCLMSSAVAKTLRTNSLKVLYAMTRGC